MKTAREISYEALLKSYRNETFLSNHLNEWFRSAHPKKEDFHLAQEISYGTMRMTKTLDYLALQLADIKKCKLKERVLIRMAIYQHHFMSKIPSYAIVNESMILAKKMCHYTFVKFLNAILRKLDATSFTLPDNDLTIRYSYPEYLVEHLIKDWGKEVAVEILELGNFPSQTMARVRKGIEYIEVKKLDEVIDNPSYYIQNITPATLMNDLKRDINPQNILDLCAAPGGKSLLAHDFFPDATLVANDVSKEKIKILEENFSKYGVNGETSLSKGELLRRDEKFDLIIIDAPCSNSGVLNKRAEARWRLNQEVIDSLKKLQISLIENALTLLQPAGQIWYLTCSILKEENEHLIEEMCQKHSLQLCRQKTVIPNREGFDGGFGASICSSYVAG